LNFRLAQRPVVDAHLVDDSAKIKTTASPSNIHINSGVYLGRWDRAVQGAIVQNAVNIDIQRLSGGTVDSRNVIPHI